MPAALYIFAQSKTAFDKNDNAMLYLSKRALLNHKSQSMFKRKIENDIKKIAQKMPVIGVVGPRQSGKTTLVRAIFSKHTYVSLENFDEREFARTDPRRFLQAHENEHGIILDEIQNAPVLLSYIQTYVDEQHRPGYVIVTGSQNILVNQAISQTLAGRIALFTLLPFSIAELKENALLPTLVEKLVFKGEYPRLYTHQLEATRWYLDYIETYVERDVRQVSNITDLNTFRKFIRLCAGRVGQLINYASLASDCGIDQRTAKSWLSVLEASYIIFFLPPHHANFNKRLIKSSKLYFYDAGLACALLNIESYEQVHTHYLRGNLVETLVIAEIVKHYYNNGKRPYNISFWQNQVGNEVDCIIEQNNVLVPVEIKSGKTIGTDFFAGLLYWYSLAKDASTHGYVIYGGDENQERSAARIVSWKNIDTIFS